nr:hypothetical protein [Streptomyces sp. 846.5]
MTDCSVADGRVASGWMVSIRSWQLSSSMDRRWSMAGVPVTTSMAPLWDSWARRYCLVREAVD